MEEVDRCKHQFCLGHKLAKFCCLLRKSVQVTHLITEWEGSVRDWSKLTTVGASLCFVFKRTQLKSCWKGGTLFKSLENLEPHFSWNHISRSTNFKNYESRTTDRWSVPENSNWWTIAVQKGESWQAQHLNSTSVVLSPRPKFECHFNLTNGWVKNCNGQFLIKISHTIQGLTI